MARRRRKKPVGFDIASDGTVTRLRRIPAIAGKPDDEPKTMPGPKRGPLRQVTDAYRDHSGKAFRDMADWLLQPFEEFERIRQRAGTIVAGVIVVGGVWLVSRVVNDIRGRK